MRVWRPFIIEPVCREGAKKSAFGIKGGKKGEAGEDPLSEKRRTIVTVGRGGDQEEQDPEVELDETGIGVPSPGVNQGVDIGIAATSCDESASHGSRLEMGLRSGGVRRKERRGRRRKGEAQAEEPILAGMAGGLYTVVFRVSDRRANAGKTCDWDWVCVVCPWTE